MKTLRNKAVDKKRAKTTCGLRRKQSNRCPLLPFLVDHTAIRSPLRIQCVSAERPLLEAVGPKSSPPRQLETRL